MSIFDNPTSIEEALGNSLLEGLDRHLKEMYEQEDSIIDPNDLETRKVIAREWLNSILLEEFKCCFCSQELSKEPTQDIRLHFHNAEPLNPGVCCTYCNWTIVVPARMKLLDEEGKEVFYKCSPQQWIDHFCK